MLTPCPTRKMTVTKIMCYLFLKLSLDFIELNSALRMLDENDMMFCIYVYTREEAQNCRPIYHSPMFRL